MTVVAGGSVLVSSPHPAASASHTVSADIALAANAVVFLDGTNYPNGSTRMGNILQGLYGNPSYTPTYINNTRDYPGTLGLYSGLGKPTGDQSAALGQQALDGQIKQTRVNDPTGTETVVAYSLGAVAASHEHSSLQEEGYPAQGLAFVLIADPERPNGGFLSRLPAGTYIPLLGITAGSATSSGGAAVTMVTRQYDGIADAPAYPVNVVADANALLGAYYLHNSDSYAAANQNAPGNIVTTSPDGTTTDILIPAAAGQLPIFMPLKQAGVPQPILVALDPALRAIIETGYTRTGDPSQQVRFALLPPPSAWLGDAQSVVTGAVVTVQRVPTALIASLPPAPSVLPPPTTPVTPPLTSTAASASSPQVQLNTVTNPATTARSNAQQAAPIPPPAPTTSVISASAKNPGSATPPTPSTPGMESSKKTNPSSTNTVGSTPSNGENPLQRALTRVTTEIGSLPGSSATGTTTGNTSSATQRPSGSSGSHGASG